MGTIWYDSFAPYVNAADLAMNYTSSNTGTILPTGGPFGDGAWEMAGGNLGIWRTMATPVQELWESFRFNVYNSVAGDNVLAAVGVGGAGGQNGCEMSVSLDAAGGVFKVWSGLRATLLGSATVTLSGGWHWIDIRYKHDASAGVMEVWLDETRIINVTGADTAPLTNSALTYFSLGDPNQSSTQRATVAGVIVTDATTGRVGDCRIEAMPPTSDASPNQGTPSTGTNHYAVVDEPQYNTSDYITMPNTSGDKEVFGHGPMVSTPAVVISVKVLTISQKSDAGSFVLEPLVISNGTEGDGPSQQLQVSWGTQNALFDVDPHTSAAWTYANVNASDIGFKVP
jgi:hypothetical protein